MTRKEAYEILSNGLVNATSGAEWVKAFEMAIDTLESKTASWRPNFRYGMYRGEKHFICSECNVQSMHYSRYCPNCGAKMESENE